MQPMVLVWGQAGAGSRLSRSGVCCRVRRAGRCLGVRHARGRVLRAGRQIAYCGCGGRGTGCLGARAAAGRRIASRMRWRLSRSLSRRLSAAGWFAHSPSGSTWGRMGGWCGLRAGRLMGGSRAYLPGGFGARVPTRRVVEPPTPADVLELAFGLKRRGRSGPRLRCERSMLAAGG
jgi:hypothetical protein